MVKSKLIAISVLAELIAITSILSCSGPRAAFSLHPKLVTSSPIGGFAERAGPVRGAVGPLES